MNPFFLANSCLGINGLGKQYTGVAATGLRTRHRQRRNPSNPLPTLRWTTLALAVLALFLMLNGARWLLHESPAASNELLVATCALDSIAGEEASLRVCSETRASKN
jgi:hypothetical protein